jgi:hypothetical protein
VPCFTLKWGRKTSDDCSSDASTLPSPTMTGDAMFNYFANEFGFSRSQVRFFDIASFSLFILLFLLTLAWSTYLLSFKKFTLIGCCLDGSSRIWRGLPTEFWLCWKVDW